jgi:aspartyl-tRNA(Asn)/glutamyl-tRNA(Gln) amidotransferase subunit C
MDVTEDLVRHVARLARVALTDEEVPRMARELARILDHVAAVQRVEVPASAETAAVPPLPSAALREDATAPSLPRDRVLGNAPDHDDVFLTVPRVLGERG